MLIRPQNPELEEKHEKVKAKIWSDWVKITAKIEEEFGRLCNLQREEDELWEEEQLCLNLAYIKRQQSFNDETHRNFQVQEEWRKLQ